jgi:hypothetical protein
MDIAVPCSCMNMRGSRLWEYTYTQSTCQASSRKPRGDPAENPAEHPGRTWRPSGPQGLDVHHRALHSQQCTASADAGGAIRTLVPVTSPPRPPPERADVHTIPGASQDYRYVPSTCTYRRLVQRRGGFQYSNVLDVLRQPAQWEDQCSLNQGHRTPSQYP